MQLGKSIVATILVAAFASALLAQDKKQPEPTVSAVQAPAPVHVDLTGTLACLGCSLKKSDGARAECSVYGHRNALKTDDGRFINFLENKYSADLVKGEKYENKRLSIHGIYHAKANQLDVEHFTVEGKTMSWCEGHKAMDTCASGK